jgi:hypothetical protein
METKQLHYDVVIIGGSIGGVNAAISAAKAKLKVALVEETKWIGGQLTSQGVPSDEHRWIESFGCTKSYRRFRNRIRDYYREHPFFNEEISSNPTLNPGAGWVSRIACEPRVSLQIFYEMLAPYINNQLIDIYLRTKAFSAEVANDTIMSVRCENLDSKEQTDFFGRFFLDATDIGSLLPLTHAAYVTGAEAKSEYNEPHAPEVASPLDMQPVTWVAALEYAKGENHTIQKPKMYDYFRNAKMDFAEDVYKLSWFYPGLKRGEKQQGSMFGCVGPNLFTYRRIINHEYFKDDFVRNDVTIFNWPENDYHFGNIYESPDAEVHYKMAKELTLSAVYWLQTEASRDDGGNGYPELKLRGDVLGTEDGLAMAPYIRESRRIKAVHTIVEQDINSHYQKSLPHTWDSVGIGCYHIDMHMTTVSHTFFYDNSWPFEIPLGIMIPVAAKNLLPACKNIGTTHLTNGCFRLHPVEWNIGEVAGHFAAYCLEKGMTSQEVYQDKTLVAEFQDRLVQSGIELHWPEDKVTWI